MRKSATVAVCVACGVICAVCVGVYARGLSDEADEARAEALERYGGEQLEVCVATRDLAPGETIDESDVESTMWLVDLLPEDAVYDVEDAVGQTVSSTILAGEVVSSRRLGDVGSDLDVPDGMVAVCVAAEDVQAVGGAIGTGSLVDVYATGSSSTSLIAQSVLVLATSTTETDDDEVNWITIAVAPELVQSIVAATQTTELYFTLPADDVEEARATATEETAAEESASEESTSEETAAESAEEGAADETVAEESTSEEAEATDADAQSDGEVAAADAGEVAADGDESVESADAGEADSSEATNESADEGTGDE